LANCSEKLTGRGQIFEHLRANSAPICRKCVGIRCDEEDEFRGLDIAEIGMEVYPDFQHVNAK